MKIELINSMGDDDTVASTARVSFDKLASNYTEEQNTKLIKYLAKHGHWTPFAHVQISCRVKVPLFLARQYFKHIVGSVKNETSRRYVDNEPTFWYPDEWRARPDKSIKQGSGEAIGSQGTAEAYYHYVVKHAQKAYNHLLRLGVCPEQARAVLPQAMFTEFVDTGSLTYWARMYKQRTEEHAQKEWEPLMGQLDEIMKEIAPIAWKELTNESS